MLDTRMPPTSSRPRRSSSSARPERLHARPSVSRGQTQAAPAREPMDAETGRRPLPSARSSRLSQSEMRLMGIATVCTAVVCALLLLYLAAYAQVTQLGIAQAQARMDLRRSQMRRELLEAERDTLESPQRITAAAAAQGMMPRGETPVNYIAAPQQMKAIQETQAEETQAEETQAASAQGNRSGDTTEDGRTAASFGH